jgi:hypothetical protein
VDQQEQEYAQPGDPMEEPGPHTRLTFIHVFLDSESESRHGQSQGRVGNRKEP